MGNPKQKWTSEEEEALKKGVAKYGPGKWKFIQKDPELNKHLHSRSNIDLKDKWRNMCAAPGQGSRDKFKNLKAKANQDAPAAPSVNVQPAAPVVPVVQDTPVDDVKEEPVKDLTEFKMSSNGPRYKEFVLEALSAAKDPVGLDINSVVTYVEHRVEASQNLKKAVQGALRRLVQAEKVEKVENFFRLKDNSLAETTTTGRKDLFPKPFMTNAQIKASESLEEFAKTAAYKVAEAENKSFMAAEAVKEVELISKLAEDADTILQLAKEILERCSRGEIATVA